MHAWMPGMGMSFGPVIIVAFCILIILGIGF